MTQKTNQNLPFRPQFVITILPIHQWWLKFSFYMLLPILILAKAVYTCHTHCEQFEHTNTFYVCSAQQDAYRLSFMIGTLQNFLDDYDIK